MPHLGGARDISRRHPPGQHQPRRRRHGRSRCARPHGHEGLDDRGAGIHGARGLLERHARRLGRCVFDRPAAVCGRVGRPSAVLPGRPGRAARGSGRRAAPPHERRAAAPGAQGRPRPERDHRARHAVQAGRPLRRAGGAVRRARAVRRRAAPQRADRAGDVQ